MPSESFKKWSSNIQCDCLHFHVLVWRLSTKLQIEVNIIWSTELTYWSRCLRCLPCHSEDLGQCQIVLHTVASSIVRWSSCWVAPNRTERSCCIFYRKSPLHFVYAGSTVRTKLTNRGLVICSLSCRDYQNGIHFNRGIKILIWVCFFSFFLLLLLHLQLSFLLSFFLSFFLSSCSCSSCSVLLWPNSPLRRDTALTTYG